MFDKKVESKNVIEPKLNAQREKNLHLIKENPFCAKTTNKFTPNVKKKQFEQGLTLYKYVDAGRNSFEVKLNFGKHLKIKRL